MASVAEWDVGAVAKVCISMYTVELAVAWQPKFLRGTHRCGSLESSPEMNKQSHKHACTPITSTIYRVGPPCDVLGPKFLFIYIYI